MEASKDTKRAVIATKAIVDGRDLNADFASILVTTEHVIAAMLIALCKDPRRAAVMLNEGLLQGVEERLSFYYARKE